MKKKCVTLIVIGTRDRTISGLALGCFKRLIISHLKLHPVGSLSNYNRLYEDTAPGHCSLSVRKLATEKNYWMTTNAIRENNITHLPASIGQLDKLVTLDLSFNQLETLPPEIGLCRQLSSIDLQHNKLTTLPESVGQLTNLTRSGH